MKATINLPTGPKTVEVGWLDVVRLFAASRGYNNVDVEPWAGKVEITASGPAGEKTVSGKTEEAAAEAMVHALA